MGTTHVANIFLLNTGILENLFNGLHGLAEEVHVNFLELGSGQGLGEVVSVFERFDFKTCALLGAQRSLGLFDLTFEFTHGTKIGGNVSAGLLLVELDEVVDDTVIEIFTTKMGITSGSQDLEDTIIDGQEGDIEGSSSEIVDDDLAFATLLIKTVRNSGGSWLVDNTKDVETGDGTGILGGLTLSVVEVGGDGDNSVGDGMAQIVLGGFLHLNQDHSGNFFRCEVLKFALMFNANMWSAEFFDNSEWPVLHILFDFWIVNLATNKTFGVEYGVGGIGGIGVLSRVTNSRKFVESHPQKIG